MLDPHAVVLTEVPSPTLALLPHAGAEDARLGEAVGLHDGGRVDDEEVDGAASSGVATSAVMCGGLCKGDGGVETPGRNHDDTHVIVELHIEVHIVLAIHDHAGDAALDEAIHSGVYEQDAIKFCSPL